MKFFNKIRQKILSGGQADKTGRYLKYAFGEIILVVIGILLALQINNYNGNLKDQREITNTLEKIAEELAEAKEKEKKFIASSDNLISQIKKLLIIVKEANPDSLEQHKDYVGAVATNWSNNRSFPFFQEFIKGKNLNKIKSKEIRNSFRTLENNIEDLNYFDETIETQYLQTIEPYFIKNINYSSVALFPYRDSLISGGPRTNYTELSNNLEFWNIITLKLELTSFHRGRQIRFLEFITKLEEDLSNEIKNMR
tara:strand:- start:19151 stop:19912 length:762 start_codon:yes stop_codon:yes gene_type:complete